MLSSRDEMFAKIEVGMTARRLRNVLTLKMLIPCQVLLRTRSDSSIANVTEMTDGPARLHSRLLDRTGSNSIGVGAFG